MTALPDPPVFRKQPRQPTAPVPPTAPDTKPRVPQHPLVTKTYKLVPKVRP